MRLSILAVFLIPALLLANELKIESVTPEGRIADRGTSVHIFFDQPMAALGANTHADGIDWFHIEPAVAGKLSWTGSRILTFTPADSLAPATSYTISVDAQNCRSLDGFQLKKDLRFRFETPRPKVLLMFPAHREDLPYSYRYRNLLGQRLYFDDAGNSLVGRSDTMYVYFNQAIDVKAALPQISLVGQKNMKPVPVQVLNPQKLLLPGWVDPNRLLVVTPIKPMNTGGRYSLIIKKGITGREGSLGSEETSSCEFSVFPEFALNSNVIPRQLNPDSPLRLRFTTPVRMSDLVKQIRFEPEVTIPDYLFNRGFSDNFDAYLSLPFRANTRYRGEISGELKDLFGNRLGRKQSFSFTTTDYPEQVYFSTGAGVIENYLEPYYPVTLVNKNRVHVRLRGLSGKEFIPVATANNLFYDSQPFNFRELNLTSGWDVDSTLVFKIAANQIQVMPIDLSRALKKHNAVLIEIDRGPDVQWGRYLRALVQVTGLGLTGKFSGQSSLIAVTDLNKGLPVAKARVELRDAKNKSFWHGTADVTGLTKAPGWTSLGIDTHLYGSKHFFAFVRTDSDSAWLDSNWESYVYDEDIPRSWSGETTELTGHLFSDRDIYRPGEEVHFKLIARQLENFNWKLPEKSGMLVWITDPRGNEVMRDTLHLSDYGSLNFSYPLPGGAPTGYYQVRLLHLALDAQRGGSWRDNNLITGSFTVSEYRAVEFKVETQFDRPFVLTGETADLTVRANYLFGAPLKQQPVRLNYAVKPHYYQSSRFEDFSFNPDHWLLSGEHQPFLRNQLSQKLMLDDNGTVHAELKPEDLPFKGTALYSLTATVQDISRQSVSTFDGLILHPGSFLLGLKTDRYLYSSGNTIQISAVSIRPDDEAFSPAQARISVFRRQWISARRAGVGGRFEWQSQHVDSLVFQQDVDLAQGIYQTEYQPAGAGLYYVQISGKDEKRREVIATQIFYVSGSEYAAWEQYDSDLVELIADKSGYQPGDTARILIKSPFTDARALITLEREGLLEEKWIDLYSSATEFKIPITEKHVPNIYAGVILLRGRSARQSFGPNGEDLGKPVFKSGYVNLKVSPAGRRLQVKVETPKDDYRPGDKVTVQIDLSDSRGQNVSGEATIAVVDVGVLNLTGYKTPDSFDTFYHPRELAVRTAESRSVVIGERHFNQKGENRGGGGTELSSAAMRGLFKTLAYWNPARIINGRGSIEFELPDNLTSFRIMVNVHTKDSRFGSGEKEIRVRKDIMLRPALPRFVRAGDSLDVSVIAHNYSGKSKRFDIRMNSGNGATATQQIELEDGASGRISYPLQINASEKQLFSFSTKGDAVEIGLPVKSAHRSETTAISGETASSVSEYLEIPAGGFTAQDCLQVTLAPSLLHGMTFALQYLLNYPYNCIEQQTSRVLPLLTFRDQLADLKSLELSAGQADQRINEYMEVLSEYRHWNGGFYYWRSRFSEPDPFLTALVLMALDEARNQDIAVDTDIYSSARDYLTNWLNTSGSIAKPNWNNRVLQIRRAFILFVLSRWNRPDQEILHAMVKNSDALPVFANACLLQAVINTPNTGIRRTGLEQSIYRALKITPTEAWVEESEDDLWPVFGSNVRATAMALAALTASDTTNPALGQMAAWLSSRTWDSTQDNFWALWALAKYTRQTQPKSITYTAEVNIDGQKLLNRVYLYPDDPPVSRSITGSDLPAGDKPAKLTFAKRGRGRLYYQARMTRTQLTSREVENGFIVQRSYRDANGQPVDLNAVQTGSVLRVDLVIASRAERHFAVIEDPLPACFEIIDSRLRTEAQPDIPGTEAEDFARLYFSHREIRDDRLLLFADILPSGVHHYHYYVKVTSSGRFQLPALHASEMYHPEVNGNSAAQKVMVK